MANVDVIELSNAIRGIERQRTDVLQRINVVHGHARSLMCHIQFLENQEGKECSPSEEAQRTTAIGVRKQELASTIDECKALDEQYCRLLEEHARKWQMLSDVVNALVASVPSADDGDSAISGAEKSGCILKVAASVYWRRTRRLCIQSDAVL